MEAVTFRMASSKGNLVSRKSCEIRESTKNSCGVGLSHS